MFVKNRLYETFDEGAEIYIVTELVEGGELFDRIVSKTSYTEKEARDLVKLLLETLAYMHGSGVVHRDCFICLSLYLFIFISFCVIYVNRIR